MSHYVAHAIVPKVLLEKHDGDLESALEEILAPYDENIQVPHYMVSTKKERIAKRRSRLTEVMESRDYRDFITDEAKYREDNPTVPENYIAYLKNISTLAESSDEELFKEITEYDEFAQAPTDGVDPLEDLPGIFTDEDGNEWSSYNPNSQWDWWVIGGRWSDEVRKKDGSEVNSATLAEIVRGKLSAPYALVSPQGWVSKGQMLWFGISDDKVQEDDWESQWSDYLDALDPTDTLAVVDLHI